ncbi:MAG: type II secretion system protein GspG [Lentisphaeria bacterium]|nr:type II secretion system protein GspG [Lentisphaeria bacterium]
MKMKSIRSAFFAVVAIFLTVAAFTGCGKSEEGAPASNASETKTEASASTTLEQQKSAPGEAELRKGLAACDKNDYEAAVKSFRAAAEQGNSDAMLLYYDCLVSSKIAKDRADSIEWLEKAAEAGNLTAQALYGSKFVGGGQEAKGIEYMKRSADSGNILGMHLLGMTAFEKKPGEAGEDALKSLKTLAGLPFSEQKTVLDYLHRISSDFNLTGKLNTNTNKLIVMDQYMLGVYYLEGRAPGGRRDLDEAAKWLKMAKDNGLPDVDPLLRRVEVMKQSPDASRTNEELQKARAEAFLADTQNQIDASEFDLRFTITDADGKPLDGVKVEMRLERPVVKLLLSGGSESKKPEEKTVDSKFSIHEKGWTSLELTFMKDGYYIEDRYYYINFMPNSPDELGPDGKPKLVMKEDVQVVMYKGVPPGDLTGTSGYLIYDLEKATKTVCDLSAFDKKLERPKKRTVSEKDEEDEEYDDEDEEDEEEYVEEIRIGMKKVDLKAKPELTKYIEVDFRRDENGEVLFDGTLGDAPCPSSFIIRLHSDDPDDGFIVVDELGPGFVRREEYEKRCPTAPETGYKKELVFDFGKKSADGKYTYNDIHTFAFVKCGQRYGKVFIDPVYVDIGRNRPLRLFHRKIQLTINRTEGDRNVSGGSFYVERERPAQTRNDLKKTDAKNEAKDASDDKAELAKEQILLIHDALEQYKLDVGTYPSSLQGLEKNVDKSERWDGPYIVPKVPRVDLWGNKYQYRFDAEKGTYRLYLISFDLSETRIEDPPESAQEQQTEPDDPKQPDIFAGLPLWNTARDGKPEVMLPRLVKDAAKRANVNLQSLGDVRIDPIDAGHSYAELDLDVVDEYGKIVRFLEEIEKKTPKLAWRRLELRVNSARERIASELQDGASAAASAKAIRMSGQVRVIAYDPAAGPSASPKRFWTDDMPVSPGETDILTLLYDLSVSLPDDALVTVFRLDNWKCEFVIQTLALYTDLPRYLRFPAWNIGRLQKRILSDDVCTFSVALQKKDNPEPRKDSVTPDKKIATIVALNLFDPEAVPRKAAASGMPASNGTRANNAKDPETELKEQLKKAINNQNELKELLKTLSNTPGATKEQTDMVEQRLKRNEQEIRRLREQQNRLRP